MIDRRSAGGVGVSPKRRVVLHLSAQTCGQLHAGIRGIIQATIPVSDLARSARFYGDLLGLRYIREFGDGTTVTGCALADFDARYFIALRRRDTLAGGAADLRGEHPVIVEAESPDAAERIRERATRLGIPSTSGTHADGTWIEFLDPDGMALRVVHTPTPTESFLGVAFGLDREQAFYDAKAERVDASSSGSGHRRSLTYGFVLCAISGGGPHHRR